MATQSSYAWTWGQSLMCSLWNVVIFSGELRCEDARCKGTLLAWPRCYPFRRDDWCLDAKVSKTLRLKPTSFCLEVLVLRHSVDPLGALSSPSESLTVTSTHMPYCQCLLSFWVVLGGTFLTFPGASTAVCLERIVTAALASTIKCREKSTLAHNRLHRPQNKAEISQQL